MSTTKEFERRVLLLPPTRADGEKSLRIFQDAGFNMLACENLEDLILELERGAGVVVATEEIMKEAAFPSFKNWLAGQASWSDLPVIILVRGGMTSPSAVSMFESLGNVMLSEFPARIQPLVSAVRSAMRARLRQYEIRQHLLQREADVIELAKTSAELMRSNRELEDFAHVCSHDLKAPLGKISSYAELLVLKCGDAIGETGKRYVDGIVASVARVTQLIDDVLSYASVSKRGPVTPVSLEETLEKVVETLEPVATGRRADITWGKLPVVRAHPVQMYQLLQNLVGNAVKFQRDETAKVRVEATEHPGDWLLAIRDNGIGFDPKYQERIFKAFHRLENEKEFPGSGVGLAICKKIVDQMQGEIWAESQPGEGATFYVRLPKSQTEIANTRRVSHH